ncbi:MAG: Fe-S cluster assembly protein SufD [Crocinitomicaceae bacterium]|nr:Fe-S cluster assembly protein SufD [Flavobacteriia bacterium]NDC27841.1 Fe-S cluster assembly protein SufD [Crocinitomicaceae bacterium]NDC92190.1 Fe-S cluster assembly protein SufD [Flavobacteriales bacterium]
MEIMENISKIQAFASKFNETNLAFSPTSIADAKNTLFHLDFPTTKTEFWKYTRLAKLAQLRLNQEKIKENEQVEAPLTDNGIVRITNGYITSFSKEIAGLTITPFSKCSEQQLSLIGKKADLTQNIFLALNTLYSQEGLFIEVEENAQIEGVFQLLFHAHGENCFAPFRVFIHVKKGSSFKLIQQFTASGEHLFSLPIVEYLIEENARISCDKLQMENASSFLLCEDYSIQKRNSTVLLNTFSISGAWVRNNSSFLIEGENCETNLNGAYLLKDLQHLDNHTIVDHIAPHCNSNELYKGILSGKATGVFNGKVFVRPNAQKISAFQSNANVLLSDDASVNSKPELEIYANDVKCSHGSTTGQLDEDAVFYLRARGLSEKSARSLITQAFITEVVDKVEQKEVRDFIQNKLVELHDWTN